MAITFPAGCNLPSEKLEHCLSMRERAQQLHNKMGRWYRATYAQVLLDQTQAKLDAEPNNVETQEVLVIAVKLKADNPPITQAQYDAVLPSPKFDRLRARYPYAPALTKTQWNDFEKNVHLVVDNKIAEAQAAALADVRATTRWAFDIEETHGEL
jgi:hypothetical protein